MKYSKSALFLHLIIVNIFSTQCFDKNAVEYNEDEQGEIDLKAYEVFNAQVRQLDPKIDETFECIRGKIQENNLDPFKFPIIPLKLNNKVIESNLLITGFQIHGLASFELTEAVISKNPLNLFAKLAVKIENIGVIFKKYKGFIRIMDMLHLYGDGSFTANFTDFNLDVKVNLKLRSIINPLKGILIKDIHFDMDLFKTKIVITGLFNDPFKSKLISRQLSKALTAIAEGEKARINSLILNVADKLVAEKINPLLLTMSTLQVLALMENAKLCEPTVEFINNGIDFIQNFDTNTNPNYNINDYFKKLSNYYNLN